MKKLSPLFTLQARAIVVAFIHAAMAAKSSAFGNSVAAQDDGKIVVAGYAEVGGVDHFALLRYNSDGSLDTSLDNNGKVTTAVGKGTCKAEGLALQDDGKIVVVGYSFNASGQSCFTMLRYGADGTLDTSFGDSGKVITTVAKHSSAESVAMQTDGKIVVAGNSFIDGKNNDFAVVRYNANGTLDTSFMKPEKRLPISARTTSATVWRSPAMEESSSPVTALTKTRNDAPSPPLRQMEFWTRVLMAAGKLQPISAATAMLKAKVWPSRLMEKPLLRATRLLTAFNNSRSRVTTPMGTWTRILAALVAF
jgi:uncharacterized delta-60 repeat protein